MNILFKAMSVVGATLFLLPSNPTTNPMTNFIKDRIKSATTPLFGSLGAGLAHFVSANLEGFFKTFHFNTSRFAQDAGANIAEATNAFFNGTGINNAGANIATSLENMVRNTDFGQVTNAFGEQVNGASNGFFDGLNLGDLGSRFGGEFRDLFTKASAEIGPGLREAMNNTLGQMAKGFAFDIFPYVWLPGLVSTVSGYGIYYLYKKALHNIGRPKLATETLQRTLLTPIFGTGKIGNDAGEGKKPVYSADVTRRIDELVHSTQNTRKNGGYFQNVLFYGPGGTGKTMISKFMARNSGMSYITMSGGDLGQYIKRGEHVTELNKLIDKASKSWRPWSTRPWILFIDEAESLCKNRDKIPTVELLELQNALLNRTSTPSKKFMLILATNRMEDLDEAVLSRMAHKIYIGPPEEKERSRIIKLYTPHFFTKSERAKFFTDPLVDKMAQKTEGLTGRALFQLLNAILNKKTSSKTNALSQEMIDEAVRDFTEQEKEIEARKKAKINGTPPLQPTPAKRLLASIFG